MLNELAKQAFEVAESRGKYHKGMQFKDILDAFKSELDEFADAFYLGKTDFEKDSMQWELMDMMLICLSVSHYFGIDVQDKIHKVIEYNKTRVK